jgi:hypothetical protein
LDLKQLEAYISQLQKLGILKDVLSDKTSAVSEFLQSQTSKEQKRWILFNPSKIITWLVPKFQWCHTRTFVITSIVIYLLALGVLLNNFSEILSDFLIVYSSINIFQILATYFICINIPSEIVRGMTAIRFGSSTNEFGIRLVLNFVPIFYCGSKIWHINEKTNRSKVLFSPIYYLLFVSSLGLLCWKIIAPGLALKNFGIIIFIVGTINTFLRLNILFPLDGSQILSNWLNVPALRWRAISIARAWLFCEPSTEPLTPKENIFFKCYGLSAGILSFSFLIIGAYFLSKILIHHLNGIGALIMVFIVMIIFRATILKYLRM